MGALTTDDWSSAIASTWRQSVESIIETGRLLHQAKEALAHGEFEAMVAAELPFEARTAQKLMAIATDQRLIKATHESVLPPSWTTLYELTKLDDAAFRAKIESGAINPKMKRRDAAPVTAVATAAEKPIDMRGAPIGARGYDIGEGRKRIIITLDDEIFEQIRARAVKAKVSFNEEAVTLLTWCLEAMDRFEKEAGAA